MTLPRMVFVARMLLGIFYLLSGLNWFFGFLPLPSIHMPPDLPIKHQVVVEMIRTGWMYQSAKVIELAAGLALVTNRFVPLMLALSAPVAFITFMLDALILDDVWGWLTGNVTTPAVLAAIGDMIIGGLCILLLQIWLMLTYLDYYRPMLAFRAAPAYAGHNRAVAFEAARTGTGAKSFARTAFLGLGWIAIALQTYNLYLFVGLIGR